VLPSQTVWSAGQTIGNYTLVANLREGGMATLFIAQKHGAAGFSRPVAIKLIHPELEADEQFRQMFLDEAMLSSRIRHPNVVQVEELGEHHGAHYLVMEFVHGCSLSQLLRVLHHRSRRLTPAFAVRIAMHVAEGLHAAHETRDELGQLLHVVHRDVSPENILLAYAGHVKLIDFGIAKAYGRRHRTEEGLLKGKFRYMAPEQAFARPVDRRTDIYQLGIVLWEMLTLRRLFDGETDVQLIQQVRAPSIAPPSLLVGRIPPELDAVVMAALAQDPEARPRDAETFGRMLARAYPEALTVDGGALRALLDGAMQDERRQAQSTYPPGLFAALEEPTVHAHGPFSAAAPSDAPAERITRPGFGSPGRGASGRVRGPRAPEPAPVRQRRLVRLATGLRTTITRITEAEWAGAPSAWLGMGVVAGLVGAMVLVLVSGAKKPKVPPSFASQAVRAGVPLPPPPPPRSALPNRDPSAPEAGVLQGTAPLSAGAPAMQLAASAPDARPAKPVPDGARDAGAMRAPKRQATAHVMVDGTPLLTEPGF